MDTAAQSDLPLFLVKPGHGGVEKLIEALKTHGDWWHAAQILEEWQMPNTDHNRRYLRALAEAASPELLSGQRGYKWIGHATAEEVNHAAGWLEAQARKMAERACSYRRRAHQIFG